MTLSSPAATSSSDPETEIDEKQESYKKNPEWVPLCQRQHISFFRMICICGSMMSYQFAYSILGALQTPLMNNVLYLPNWLTQIVWIIGPLVGIFWQPLVGYWNDDTHFKWGRRRPFILIGSLGAILSYCLLFTVVYVDSMSLNVKRGVFVLGLFCAHMFINVSQGPARFIVGDIIPKHLQVRANSIGALMIAASAIILNLFGGFRVARHVEGLDDYEFTIVVGICFMVITMIMTLVSGHEEQYQGKRTQKNPFKELCTHIKEIPKSVIVAAFALMCSWAAYWPYYANCTSFFGTNIFRDQEPDPILKDDAELDGICFGMLVIALQSLVSVLYSLVQDYVVKLIGMKWSYAASQILEAIVLLPMNWIKNKWGCMALLSLMGIGYTAFQTIPFSLVGILIGEDKMGTCMGALAIFVGVGQQIGALVICSGIGKFFEDSFKEVLSISSAFAVVAAICAAFIPVHHQQENDVPLSEESHMPKTFNAEDELAEEDQPSGNQEVL